MLRYYSDILVRINEEPLWYDDNGVPRFEPYQPKLGGVYDHISALVSIECQACRMPFDVMVAFTVMDQHNPHTKEWTPLAEFIPTKAPGAYHYGDPPPHGCVGDTMNCLDIRIKEFWQRTIFQKTENGQYVPPIDFDWHRMKSEEITLEDYEPGEEIPIKEKKS